MALGEPAWVRTCSGGGLRTALNKVAPKEGVTPVARLASAEDADTGFLYKTLARTTASPIRDATGPHQLGIGVSGVEFNGISFKVHFWMLSK